MTAPEGYAPVLTGLADLAEANGAPRLASQVRTSAARDGLLCAVADELRRRGRDGLASQVLAMRFDADA